MTRFCTSTCSRWVTRVGNSRRRCTAARSASVRRPSRKGTASRLAAATASWIARLMPTPPTGDMACAASPMQSSPARYQSRSRSTATVSSLTSSQRAELAHAVGSERRRAVDDLARGTPRRPRPRSCLERALGDDEGALPVVAAVDHARRCARRRTRASGVGGSLGVAREAEPEHVDRRAEVARPRGRARSRTVEWRPSAPTTRSARTSKSPSGVVARTPTTRPSSSTSSRSTSARMRRSKRG